MSLSDARRLLQWNVVMEALAAAEVDTDTIALIESARQAGDLIHSLANTLLCSADAKQAKNYVKVEMIGLIAPFERAYVELVRPGGKTSHELRELLRDQLRRVKRALLGDAPDCAEVISWIDETLAAEAP